VKPTRLLLAVPLLLLGVAPTPSAATCAAPWLTAAPGTVLERGVPATVEGRAFVDGCRDSMTCGIGCGACEYDDPPPEPYRDVDLRLVQDGRSWHLGTTDAASAEAAVEGRVRWRVTVPAAARPGRARLVADHAEPVSVRIR